MVLVAGKAAAEGAKINQSLTTLSRIIQLLSDGSKAPATIPFRESKLTHFLSSTSVCSQWLSAALFWAVLF